MSGKGLKRSSSGPAEALLCLGMPSFQMARPGASTHTPRREIKYTGTLARHMHTCINTRKQTCAHLHAPRCTRTFTDTCTRANNVHTRTRSAPASSLKFFSPGKIRGDEKSPPSPVWRYAPRFQSTQGRGVAPRGDLVSFLTPQLRQLSNSPFNLPRFNLLPRNSLSAKS